MPPDWIVTALSMVSVPVPSPPRTTPPELTNTVPLIRPVPPSRPPESTVTALLPVPDAEPVCPLVRIDPAEMSMVPPVVLLPDSTS